MGSAGNAGAAACLAVFLLAGYAAADLRTVQASDCLNAPGPLELPHALGTVRIVGPWPTAGADSLEADEPPFKCAFLLLPGASETTVVLNELHPSKATYGCTCTYGSSNGCGGSESITVYNGQSESASVLLSCCGTCTSSGLPCDVTTFGATSKTAKVLVVVERPTACYDCGGGDGVTFSWGTRDEDGCLEPELTGRYVNYRVPPVNETTAASPGACGELCEADDACDLWTFCADEAGCSQMDFGRCDLKTWGDGLGKPPLWDDCPFGCGFVSSLSCGRREKCPPYAV